MRPTELLKQEHRTIEGLLDRLEWTAIVALRTGSLEVTLTRRLVHVLSVILDRWHRQKEEELLFPLIEERGVLKIVIRAALMQEEHDSGHEELLALEAALDPAAKMDPAVPKTLSCRAVAFVDQMRRHMRKEEEIVFPLAEASLREVKMTGAAGVPWVMSAPLT
jgi:hemerythrin-like domain-containing protein